MSEKHIFMCRGLHRISNNQSKNMKSNKSKTIALLLVLFLGLIGAHRMYVGKVGTGILILVLTVLSWGILGLIWAIVDLVLICTDRFKDKQGRFLTE